MCGFFGEAERGREWKGDHVVGELIYFIFHTTERCMCTLGGDPSWGERVALLGSPSASQSECTNTIDFKQQHTSPLKEKSKSKKKKKKKLNILRKVDACGKINKRTIGPKKRESNKYSRDGSCGTHNKCKGARTRSTGETEQRMMMMTDDDRVDRTRESKTEL